MPSGTSLKKEYTLYPLLGYNKERRGIALDGQLKYKDTNLASSSMWDAQRHAEIHWDTLGVLTETETHGGTWSQRDTLWVTLITSFHVCLRVKQEVLKEVQGILVSYKVVIRMIASGWVWAPVHAGTLDQFYCCFCCNVMWTWCFPVFLYLTGQLAPGNGTPCMSVHPFTEISASTWDFLTLVDPPLVGTYLCFPSSPSCCFVHFLQLHRQILSLLQRLQAQCRLNQCPTDNSTKEVRPASAGDVKISKCWAKAGRTALENHMSTC